MWSTVLSVNLVIWFARFFIEVVLFFFAFSRYSYLSLLVCLSSLPQARGIFLPLFGFSVVLSQYRGFLDANLVLL